MTFTEIEAYIESVKNNSLLYFEKNFDDRTDAIDFLEFHILDQIETLRKAEQDQGRLTELHNRAEKVKFQLEDIDNELFQKLQWELKHKRYCGKELESLVK